VPPDRLIEYRYAEGPGALSGDAAAGFYGWLARVTWPGTPPGEAARAEADREPGAGAEATPDTVKMYAAALAKPEEKRGGFSSGT
jgi:hypothetical protein